MMEEEEDAQGSPLIVPNQQSVRVGVVFHPHYVPAGRNKKNQ